MPYGNPFPLATTTVQSAKHFVDKVRTHKVDLRPGDYTPASAGDRATEFNTRRDAASQFLVDQGTWARATGADKHLSDLARARFDGVAKLAGKLGTHIYAKGFGAWGLAGRISGVALPRVMSDEAAAVTSNMLASLSGTAHDPAVKDTQTKAHELRLGATEFVPPPGGASLPENTAGNIVKSYTPALFWGQSANDAVKLGSRLAANSIPGLNKAQAEWADFGIQLAFAVTPFIVGVNAGINSARTFAAVQAEAGFSLSTPLTRDDGTQAGNLLVHREPQQVGNEMEIARLQLVDNDNDMVHTVAIRSPVNDPDPARHASLVYVFERDTSISPQQQHADRPRRGKREAVADFARRTADYVAHSVPGVGLAAPTEIRNDAGEIAPKFQGNSAWTKTAAISSTLAGAEVMRRAAQIQLEAAISGNPCNVGDDGNLNVRGQALLRAGLDLVTNFNLSAHLIPAWMGNGRTTDTQVSAAHSALRLANAEFDVHQQDFDRQMEALDNNALSRGPVLDDFHLARYDYQGARRLAAGAPNDTALTEATRKLAVMTARLAGYEAELASDNAARAPLAAAVTQLSTATEALADTTEKRAKADVADAPARQLAANQLAGDLTYTTAPAKVLTAGVPVIGGALTGLNGQVRSDLPAMTKQTFAPYAVNEILALRDISTVLRNHSLTDDDRVVLETRENGRLALNDRSLDRLLEWARHRSTREDITPDDASMAALASPNRMVAT